MATEKDRALARHLTKLAAEGKLKWEPTASNNEYTASLKGKYNVLISRGHIGFIRNEGDPEFTLKLIDDNEQELVRLTEHESSEVGELFELARRTSLNVDAVIDEILSEDKDELPF